MHLKMRPIKQAIHTKLNHNMNKCKTNTETKPINRVIVISIKCQKTVTTLHFPRKVTYSDRLVQNTESDYNQRRQRKTNKLHV